MSHTALIKLAPVYDSHLALGPVHGGGTLYERGCFRTISHQVPVVVDHDTDREVGIVRQIVEIPDTDGEWFVALATISEPVAWIRGGRGGTKASFAFKGLHRRTVNGWEVVCDALLSEVSVLTPSFKPIEPRAHVLTLRRTESDRPAAGEVFYGDGTLIRRYYTTPITVR